MVEEMGRLSSAEFERVLHPVFEEDEWTLILIGTALGGIAGVLQATAAGAGRAGPARAKLSLAVATAVAMVPPWGCPTPHAF